MIRKPTYETATCRYCGKPFRRLATASRKALSCGSKRCKKIAAINRNPGKPVGFGGIRNDPSQYRADIDYHGSVMP